MAKTILVLTGEAAEFAFHDWQSSGNRPNAVNRWFTETFRINADSYMVATPSEKDFEDALSSYEPFDKDGKPQPLEVVSQFTLQSSGMFGSPIRRAKPSMPYKQILRISFDILDEALSGHNLELERLDYVGTLAGYKFEGEGVTAAFDLTDVAYPDEHPSDWSLVETQAQYNELKRQKKL